MQNIKGSKFVALMGLVMAAASGLTKGIASGAPAGMGLLRTQPGRPRSRGQRAAGSRRSSTYFPPEKRNGARECARRKRQIDAGRLQVSR